MKITDGYTKMIKKKMKDNQAELRRTHLLSLFVVMLNVLFDYDVYYFIHNSEVALVLCTFVNSCSARWVLKKYSLNNYTRIFWDRMWILLHFLIIISFVSLSIIIYQFLTKFLINLF
jgi:hypothetical protein